MDSPIRVIDTGTAPHPQRTAAVRRRSPPFAAVAGRTVSNSNHVPTMMDPPGSSQAITPAAADERLTLSPGPATDAPVAPPQAAMPPVRKEPSFERLRFFLRLRLVILAVLLGLVTASVPARNSDLWLHLATGRLLAAGEYHLGSDPFAHTTTAAAYWVNHAWLADLAAYRLYDRLGGQALVVAKVVVVLLLTVVLLATGWQSGGRMWPAVGALLALVALNPRLQLQPVLLSYLFLALTLLVLEWDSRRASGKLTAYWPLAPLFALWVNLDSWFLLGPLTVALYLAGEVLHSLTGKSRSTGKLRELALMLVLGLAACLLNPYGIHAFSLPPQFGLSETARSLPHDPLFQDLSASPFRVEHWETLVAGPLWARPAYYLLVVLGLASFAVNWQGRCGGRALVWLGLLALSAYQSWAIPFFAVASGPLLALNFQEFARRRALARGADMDRAGEGGLFVQLLAVAAGLALVVFAWTGWLQPELHEPRGWTVEPDPSLVGTATQLASWHREGKLHDDQLGFNFSPDVANYFAWFCPQERGFFDTRLQVCAPVAGEYVTVRQGLMANPDAGDWRAILRQRHVDHLVVYDKERENTVPVFRQAFLFPEEWVLLYQQGNTAVFGWVDPEAKERGASERFAGLRLDLEQLAFHPAADKRATAPAEHAHVLWTPDRDEASVHLLHFEAQMERRQAEKLHLQKWHNTWLAELYFCPLTTGPATLTIPEDLTTRLRLPHDFNAYNFFVMGQDDAPLSLLLLSVRAARRALPAEPDDAADATAYLVLGEAYLYLSRNTRERSWGLSLGELRTLREVQAAAALNHALALKPDLDRAHIRLDSLFFLTECADLALEHRQQHLALVRKKGREPKETPDEFRKRVEGIEQSVQALQTQVEQREKTFQAQVHNLSVPDRARLAMGLGLGGEALDLLLKSDISAFGPAGTKLELELLLTTGQADKMREFIKVVPEQTVGIVEYSWLQLQLAAASGDYDAVEVHGEKMIRGLEPLPGTKGAGNARTTIAVAVSEAILNGGVRAIDCGVGHYLLGEMGQNEGKNPVAKSSRQLRRAADVRVLCGLLALEAGEVERAEKHFRNALDLWHGPEAGDTGVGLDFAGRPAAEQGLELIRQGARAKPAP